MRPDTHPLTTPAPAAHDGTHGPTHGGTLWALTIGAALVGVVAMAASAATLAALGHAVGWTQWGGLMAWSLPVSVDALALVAGVAWLARGVSDEARSLARWMTLSAVVSSVVLNAVGHLVESGDVVVGPQLRIAVSAVPPVVAALTVHLVVTALTGRTTVVSAHQETVSGVEPAPVSAPVSEPVSEPVSDTVSAPEDAPEKPVSAPAPRRRERRPDTVSDPTPEMAKLTEKEALTTVADLFAAGAPQSRAVAQTGWSAGWVAKQYKRLREQPEPEPGTERPALTLAG